MNAYLAEALEGVGDLPGAAIQRRISLAVERLYRDVRDREEANLWSRAREDSAFRAEMREIAVEYGDLEDWPQ